MWGLLLRNGLGAAEGRINANESKVSFKTQLIPGNDLFDEHWFDQISNAWRTLERENARVPWTVSFTSRVDGGFTPMTLNGFIRRLNQDNGDQYFNVR